MGFKKENYTPKGLCFCIYFILVTNIHSITGQTHCPIRVEYEPREDSQSRSANNIHEIKFPFYSQWENLSAIKSSDDSWSSIVLPSNKRSTVFKGQNLGFSIPTGAQIEGIELIVEGHSIGSGHADGLIIKLLDEEGTAYGENKANKMLPIDHDWMNSSDSTDFVWRYGASNDTWGLSFTEDQINNNQFGYAIQVRNKLNEPISVFIDQVQVIVHYTPLYEICSTHACVPFYVDESDDPLVKYEWYIPEGFELISDSEEDAAINIGVSYAEFGEYEICVESFYKNSSLGICCRSFNYSNCEPALIAGNIFRDKDNNSSYNVSDEGIGNIQINLYSGDGISLASTFSNVNGGYSFTDLLSGQYYIEVVDNIDSLVFTTPNIGNDDFDSDITDAFGPGTTELINLSSGDSITNIGAGFNLALSIGDFVWEDLNGDGVQQLDEPGLEGVEVVLTSALSSIYTTTSDQNGNYIFNGLPAGDYTLDFIAQEGFVSTIPNNTTDSDDSDYIPNTPIFLSYSVGGSMDSIDAGFYQLASLGDFVWEDLNENGLQDNVEPGVSGAILELKTISGESIRTTESDSLGFYYFKSIPPGNYFIEIQTDTKYSPTIFQVNGELSEEIDSDIFLEEGKMISDEFTITSGTNNLTIDFGLIEKPATLGGFTFYDENNNGQYDSDEGFVPEIDIFLFDANGVQIDSTQSDQGGFYIFNEIPTGSYYLIFSLRNDILFTSPDLGDDLSDSDVTNSITDGSTDTFNLFPEEENYSISAGYQKKPKVGDYVWLDENANGIQDDDENGLNDVTVELYNDQNELLESTQTSQNFETNEAGYYIFESLNPGNYYIKVPENELYNFAIVDENSIGTNSTITGANGIGTSNIFGLIGNECNLDIDAGYAFKKGNLTGEVWVDINEDGIQDQTDLLKSNVPVSLFKEDGTLVLTRNTNENGEYIFTGLDAGIYYVVFSPIDQYRFTNALVGSDNSLDSDVTNEIVSGSTALISVADGITTEHVDAGLIDGVVKVSGLTWLDDNGDGIQQENEDPLSNVQVKLYDLNDSLLASVTTNLDGIYSFSNVLAGDYYLVFTPENQSFVNTLSNQGSDEGIDDDVTSFFSVGSTDKIEIIFFQDKESINAGYYLLSSIGDQVFIDANENGINDLEAGLNDVIVNLVNDAGTIVFADTTKQGGGLDSGYYLIENIHPGTYTVEFIRPLFYQFVDADQGTDDNIDSDVVTITNNIGTTEEITITSGTNDLTIDAGVFFQVPMESSISGIIWLDTNANGLRENDEVSVPLVALELENLNGELVGLASSDVDGHYIFEDLAEGFYTVKAKFQPNKVITYPNIGTDDNIDSDFFESSGEFVTDNFFLATFEDIVHVDLGLVKKLQIGDFAWEDSNNNGMQDAGELGIEEIEITVTNENGIISETVMSDANGNYTFENLPAGFYKICADLPSGFNFALSNVGADLLDSDVDSSGCTMFMDYTNGGIVQDLDIGFTKNGSIEGFAFIDLNGNGINNANDPGLDGVNINLHSATGELLESTTTSTIDDVSGIFKFSNLKATDYYLVFEYPEEYIITSPDVNDDISDSDITGFFGEGSTDLFAVPSGGIVTTVNGGAYLPASIGDEVWLDENENGLRDENENGVPNIDVIIFRSFGVPFDTTKTDSNGLYQFENLKQGLYFIQFVIPQDFVISPNDQGIDDEIDSDADETGKTPLISLAHGADLESVDCGIFSSMASLRSVVWNDSNGDGIRQNQEARISGIAVTLLDPLDNVVDSTETNSLGLYAFQQIPEGDYKIYVDIVETDYAFTAMNMDDNDYLDSDIKVSGESEMFASDEQSSLLSVPNVDAGLQESGGIISLIWEDVNYDGVFDLTEKPIEGVEVSVYSKSGSLIKQVKSTDEIENLVIDKLPPGEYFMKYNIKDGYVNTDRLGQILDDNNSDATQLEGSFISPSFLVSANELTTHIDAGFYKGAHIISKVWYDSNGNGWQDENGASPAGVYVTLYNSSGQPKGTKGIDESGEVHFSGIPKGDYYMKFYSLSELIFTKNIVSDNNSDVDHTYGQGTTKLFEFTPYKKYTDVDAGLLQFIDVAQLPQSVIDSNFNNEIRNNSLAKEDDLLFEVHPNPAANYLKINIDRTQSEGNISIHNNQNQLVLSEKVRDIDRIDISALHPGVYYVKYELNGQSEVRKILKIQ